MSRSRNKNVLVVAPHQDDEIIGCGGIMALFIEKDYDVFVVHVFKGSLNVANKTDDQAHLIRHKEAVKASEIVNFKLLENLGFEDRKEIDTTKIQNALISVEGGVPNILRTYSEKNGAVLA